MGRGLWNQIFSGLGGNWDWKCRVTRVRSRDGTSTYFSPSLLLCSCDPPAVFHNVNPCVLFHVRALQHLKSHPCESCSSRATTLVLTNILTHHSGYFLLDVFLLCHCLFKSVPLTLAGVVQLVEAASHKPEGCQFNSQSGNIPGLQVRSPVAPTQRQKRMISVSLWHLCFSPSISPALPFSLKSISMSSGKENK